MAAGAIRSTLQASSEVHLRVGATCPYSARSHKGRNAVVQARHSSRCSCTDAMAVAEACIYFVQPRDCRQSCCLNIDDLCKSMQSHACRLMMHNTVYAGTFEQCMVRGQCSLKTEGHTSMEGHCVGVENVNLVDWGIGCIVPVQIPLIVLIS